MKVFVCCLLSLLAVSTASNAGLFDISEYRRISYDATIGEDFLWFAPEFDLTEVSASNIDELEKRILSEIPKESEPNYIFVTSKGGQKFACALPDVEGLTTPKAPRSSKNPKIYGDALAASFYVDKCIRLRGNNWWAYTLCRGQTVEQVHGDEGQEGYAKNILGMFDGNYVMPPYHESTDDRLLYVEESYTSGTFCDLAEFREPRKTSVRYECDAQLSTNEAYIQSVVEVRPCEYLMTVKVGSLCHFPEFLPVSQANTQNIGCQPYMSREDVRSLLEKTIQRKNDQEKLVQEAEVAKHLYRVATDRYTAMLKGQRKLHVPDVLKRINAEMDYRATHYDFMIYTMRLAGEPINKKEEDMMFKVLTKTDTSDYQLYVDYDTIADENKGHLWYYFHSPTWPKNQFPKDIYSAAIQNGYLDELQEYLYSSEYNFDMEDGGYLVELKKFLATGVVDLKSNLVISALDIYNDIAEQKMEILEGKKYDWLYFLFGKLLVNEEGTVDKILSNFVKQQKNTLPLNNHSISAMEDLFLEIEKDLKFFTMHGDKHMEWKKTRNPRRKFIYDTLIAKPAPPDMKKRGYDYQLVIANQTVTQRHLERTYELLLVPIYQMLSIQWFQQVFPPVFFHTQPSSDEYLWDVENDDWKYHTNMATDMVKFIKMLAAGTIIRIEHMILLQSGEYKHLDESWSTKWFFKRWPELEEKLFKDEDKIDEAVKDTFYDVFDHYGPMAVNEARERLWKKKVERYRTNYWVKDYKLRKEAKAIHGMMVDILSMKQGSDVISTVGGSSTSRKEKALHEDLKKKVKSMLDLSSTELEELMGIADGKVSDKLQAALDDEDFLGFDEIKEVLDLLGKAGLSKKTEVQIKLFDANGNEIAGNDVDAAAKNLLDTVDSVVKFRDLEKAYSAKPSWNDEEEENEDDDTEK